jgi:class 3 adenylate cyclase/tetratricopeptide (TPR) repeat protein
MDPEVLTSFLPIELVSRALAARAEISERGAVMFIDISGFTRITNEHTSRDPARGGVNAVSSRLDAEFGTWIDLVQRHGGEVLKFAGDALLAFWRTDSEQLAAVALAAATCARELQDRRGAAASELRIRIGIEVGELHSGIVDLGPGRCDLLITGATLDEALRAQSAANPGEVVLGPRAAECLERNALGEYLAESRMRLDELEVSAAIAPARVRGPLPAVADLLPFVPPAVSAGHVGEIRQVSVVFLSVPPGPLVERRRLLAEDIAVVVGLYGGVINKLNVDDKGLSALIAFGLPGSIYIDGADRTLYTTLVLRARCPNLRMGVATGAALCGVVGNARRREYTLIGGTVNRAARLMQACSEGAALCDEPTAEAASATIVCRSHGKLDLHGFGLVPVHEPVRPRSDSGRHATVHRSAFVGFPAELQSLVTLLGRLGDGAGCPLVALLEGEAGIGKSRLVDEALARASVGAARIHRLSSEAYNKGIAYHAWLEFFHPIGQLGGEAIMAHLAGSPELLPHLHLLNPLLGLDFAETDLSRQIEPEVRAARTRDLLVELLRLGLAGSHAVFVLEDAHWFDTASWALILALARSTLPVVLIITYEQWQDPPAVLQELQRLAGQNHLRLGPLSSADIRQLVRVRLGVDELPAALAEAIRDIAQGNPARAKQLVHALIERNIVAIRGADVHVDEPRLHEFRARPSPGDNLVIGRIDRLTPVQQAVVRAAACIGRRFRVDLLAAMLPDMTGQELAAVLASLVALRMFSVDTRAARPSYQFTYPRTRDVVDANMITDVLQPLHRRIAEWSERNGLCREPWHAAPLAQHWRLAGDACKAIDYFAQAGEYALAGHLCREAVESYTGALELADGEQGIDANRRAVWLHARGVAHLKLGEHRLAQVDYTRALALVGVETGDRRVSHVRSLIGHASRQLLRRLLRRRVADPPAPAIPEPVTAPVARIYQGLAEIAFFHQERLRLLQTTLACLNHAEGTGDRAVLAWAYATMAIVAGLFRLHFVARSYSRSSIEAAGSSDTGTEAYALLLQGVYHSTVPNPDQVGYLAAAELFQNLGDRSREATARLAEAFYRLALGDLELAAAVCQAHLERLDLAPQLRVWTLSGHLLVSLRRGVPDRGVVEELDALLTGAVGARLLHADHILGYGVVALAHLRRGDLDRARERANMIFVKAEKQPTIMYTSFGLHAAMEVFLALAADDEPRAGMWLKKAARAASLMRWLAVHNPIVAPRATLARGHVACARGQLARAMRRWRRALVQTRRANTPYGEALANLAIGTHLPTHDAARAGHLERARAILDPLGVRPEWSGVPLSRSKQ